MKLGVIKRILKDDLSKAGQVPAWVDLFLQPLNDFIEKVGLSLQGRLTFVDNFLCKIVSQSFTSGTESILNPQLQASSTLKVQGVIAQDASGATVTGFRWARKPNGNIGVTFTFSDATSATCSLVILLG